jgi:hypothetical protein
MELKINKYGNITFTMSQVSSDFLEFIKILPLLVWGLSFLTVNFWIKWTHRDVCEMVKPTQHVDKWRKVVCIQIKMCSNFKLSISCQVKNVINQHQLVKFITILGRCMWNKFFYSISPIWIQCKSAGSLAHTTSELRVCIHIALL